MVSTVFKTLEEIHQAYDGQWIFLINCALGEHNSTLGREVVISSERRDKALREMEYYYTPYF